MATSLDHMRAGRKAEAIEALFAGEIDITYIGPNPAISGYVRSQGEALRIVAGATSGGAALVVRNEIAARPPFAAALQGIAGVTLNGLPGNPATDAGGCTGSRATSAGRTPTPCTLSCLSPKR